MEKKDKPRLILAMAKLSVAFREQVTKAHHAIYWEFLEDFKIEEVEWAVNEAIRYDQWFPKVARLCEIIFEGKRFERVDGQDPYLLKYEGWEKESMPDCEEARKCLQEIQEKLGPDESVVSDTLTGDQAQDFEKSRELAKQKAKGLVS